MTTTSGLRFRKRTYEEMMRSKEIYKKHALKNKAEGYPEKRAKRMLAYSACLTRAIAEHGSRK